MLKFQTEITDVLGFWQKLLLIPKGVLEYLNSRDSHVEIHSWILFHEVKDLCMLQNIFSHRPPL